MRRARRLPALAFAAAIAGALAGPLGGAGLGAAPAHAESERLSLHPGRPDQDRVGRLAWRGGVALAFDDARFGGISAIESGAGGATLTALTSRGDRVRLELVEDAGGTLIDARLLALESLTGAGGRSVNDADHGDIEAIARTPDGGWVVVFEHRHRLLQFPASREPLSGTPRLIGNPRGLERARPDRGIKAATELPDRKLLLIAEDIATLPGFTMAWIGNGAEWTPMSYTLHRPFRPVGAAMLPDGDIVVVERSDAASLLGAGTRIARIHARRMRPGAPIQTVELARLAPPYVRGNFEAVAATRTPSGQAQIYLASDNDFDPDTPTIVLKFDVLP